MSALSELLNKANGDGLSSRQIQAAAEAKGVKVGHSTVAKCLNGTHAAIPDENTLRALSVVLGVSMRLIRKAVDLPGEVTELRLPPEASRLTPRQWEAVNEVIRSMVNPEGNARRRGGLSLVPPDDEDAALLDDIDSGKKAARRNPEE